MKINKHFENCSAPLCEKCDNGDAIWYAGEEICSCTPMSDVQKKQKRINKEFLTGRYKDVDKPYTYLFLHTHSF